MLRFDGPEAVFGSIGVSIRVLSMCRVRPFLEIVAYAKAPQAAPTAFVRSSQVESPAPNAAGRPPDRVVDPRRAESVAQFQTDLRARLLSTFARPDYHPPVLPSVAVELVRLSYKLDVGIQDVVQVLEKDPVLAGDVLRLAQSVVYSTRDEPRTIQQAIQRIGLRRAADLFLRAALEAKVFRVASYARSLEKLRRHSIATAEIGRAICRQLKRDEGYAYLCGLLHDVGIAGAIIAVADSAMLAEQVAFETIWPALSSVHAQFTVQMAQLWGLPDELRVILRHHHTFAVEPALHPMAAVTVLAEIMAEGSGFGFHGEQADCLIEDACERLQLSAVALEAIERDAVNTISHLNL